MQTVAERLQNTPLLFSQNGFIVHAMVIGESLITRTVYLADTPGAHFALTFILPRRFARVVHVRTVHVFYMIGLLY